MDYSRAAVARSDALGWEPPAIAGTASAALGLALRLRILARLCAERLAGVLAARKK